MTIDGGNEPELVESAIQRRTLLKAAGGVAGAGLLAGCTGGGSDGDDGDDGGGGGGSDFPSQDVLLLIPYGPGGGYDTYVRLTAPYVEKHLPNDVTVRVQNVEGAGGQIATEQVYNEEPDGYTNMIVNVSDFAMNQLQEDVDYDLREMTWYAQTAEDLRGIGVGAHTGIETWDEFVEAVSNDELRFYSPGPGSGQVVVPGVLGELSGLYTANNVIDNTVVYDGRGEAFQGMLAGDVDAMAGTYHSILPYTESGDVRMIMTCNLDEEPPETTPDSPTLATAGVDNAEEIIDMITGRRAYAGPPDVPEGRATVLRDAFEGALNDEEFLAEAAEDERPIQYLGAEETSAAVTNMIDQWDANRDLLETLFE